VAELQEYFSSKDIEVEKSDSKDLFDDVRAIISATSKLWENSDSKGADFVYFRIFSKTYADCAKYYNPILFVTTLD